MSAGRRRSSRSMHSCLWQKRMNIEYSTCHGHPIKRKCFQYSNLKSSHYSDTWIVQFSHSIIDVIKYGRMLSLLLILTLPWIAWYLICKLCLLWLHDMIAVSGLSRNLLTPDECWWLITGQMQHSRSVGSSTLLSAQPSRNRAPPLHYSHLMRMWSNCISLI